MKKMNDAAKKRLIEIKGRTWQYDDLLVEFSSDPHSKEKQIHGLGLCEQEPRALLIQPVEVEELRSREGLFEEISTIRDAVDMPFAIVFLAVEDWNQQLSPWQAPAVFGKQDFGAGAKEMLEAIETILPAIIERCYNLPSDAPVVLGGYSLAALFSLWSAYESQSFTAIAAASRKNGALQLGVSTRAAISLLRAGQARALLMGRDYVSPEDIQKMAEPVLAHRLVLSPEARMRNMTAQRVLANVLSAVQVPVKAR